MRLALCPSELASPGASDPENACRGNRLYPATMIYVWSSTTARSSRCSRSLINMSIGISSEAPMR